MSLCKSLDKAIMLYETAANPTLSACYWVDGRPYENYLSNESWSLFKKDMEKNHPSAFSLYALGSGKEMEERRVGKYTYPPKMASFGSSSRMIYNLMKDNPKFMYEKKLPTTIGGIANLDGFMETAEKCVFVEAKCREPYGTKSNEIANKYRSLYEFLTLSSRNNLTCIITPTKEGKMAVQFFAEQKELLFFDIKQMICHLLGVATAYLQGMYENEIDFIYLLYNPTHLHIANAVHLKEIIDTYHNECRECESLDFHGLFLDILSFLQEKQKIGVNQNIERIANIFSFRMCDQYSMYV